MLHATKAELLIIVKLLGLIGLIVTCSLIIIAGTDKLTGIVDKIDRWITKD